MNRSIIAILTAILALCLATTAWGEVKVEKVAYFGQPNCYKLSNASVEVIVTTDIGPRIIRYAPVGGSNMLAELPTDTVKTELGDWKPYGGHRLWHAPESKPRTYSPDNDPVKVETVDGGIKVTQKVEPATHIEKEMTITLAAEGSAVTIVHKLTNRGLWPVDLAPWALTIMAGGGSTIVPQEPYIAHEDYLLPARPMVLWHYTDLSDTRWTWGKKYVRLRTDAARDFAQKIGFANKQGWAGYLLDKNLFIKRFGYRQGSTYPDQGCNMETFTKGTFMEVESVGPMVNLTPAASVEHVERWYLFKGFEAGDTEATLDAAITPVIAQTEGIK